MAKKKNARNQNKGKCVHIRSIGQNAAFTDPGCPHATMCLGDFVCIKGTCKSCKDWEAGRNQGDMKWLNFVESA